LRQAVKTVDKAKKVLLVDDSRVCRAMYRKELEKGGFEVIEAQDGLEALSKVQETAVDLVVLDIEMPNMNGYEVCERLRSEEFATRFYQNREGLLPVIFVTSNRSLEGRVKGFNKGASDFITKGFQPGALLAAVQKILNPMHILVGLRCLVVTPPGNPLSEQMREMGMIVDERHDGLQAFDALYHHAERYDMVAAEADAAGMGGVELCQKARRVLGLKSLPIIVITDREDREHLMTLFEAGVTDYLIRPYQRQELFARLRGALDIIHALQQEIEARVKAANGGPPPPPPASGIGGGDAEDLARLTTSILHNLGNVLNSVFVSCYQLSQKMTASKIPNMLLALNLVEDNQNRLEDFLTRDQKGKLLPTYLINCGKKIAKEQEEIAGELGEMEKKIALMKEIIETQQSYAKGDRMAGCNLVELMEAALKVQTENLRRNRVQVKKRFKPAEALVSRVKLTQVLINLLKNAIDAMRESERREMGLEIGYDENGRPFLEVADTGGGIAGEHLPHLFEHGFTTKRDGHGFGLSYCLQAVRDMGGELTAISDGLGKGAAFRVTLPESKD